MHFLLGIVDQLGGNIVDAALAALDLIQQLLNAGVTTGRPVPVSLLLRDKQLLVLWDRQGSFKIATLPELPPQETIAQLCLYLRNSTASADPEILLRRNAEMDSHFADIRARAEKAM